MNKLIGQVKKLSREELVKLASEVDNLLRIQNGNGSKKGNATYKLVFKHNGKLHNITGNANAICREVVKMFAPQITSSKEVCLFLTGRPTANFRTKREFAKCLAYLSSQKAEVDFKKSKLPSKE